MNYIELLINDPANASLDLNQEVDLALQYSIADIKDISKRNAAYSKTIILPGTKTNNYWFGNLFDVNSDFSQFNPNKKTTAKLLVNTETVIDGFLQLRKITKLNNTDHQGNLINYECVIYNNSVDLMSVLGEKSINDLDMTQYGHTFSRDNIVASWNHTWRDGYVYPMFGLDNGPNEYKPEYFYPAVFYKNLLDTIIREAGFGWTGSLYTNSQFENEIISYVSDGRPKISEVEVDRRKFYVGRTQSLTLAVGNWQDANLNVPTFYPPMPSFSGGGGNVRLNDETTAPFFDNDNNYNTSTWIWTTDRNGKFTCGGAVRLRLKLANTNPSFAADAYYTDPNTSNFGLTSSLRFTMKVAVQVFDTNTNSWTGPNSPWTATTGDVITGGYIPANSFILSNPITLTFQGSEKYLNLGSKVRVAINVSRSTAGYNPTVVFRNQGLPVGTDVSIEILGTASNGQYANYFFNNPVVSEFTQNEYIDFGRYLPEKVKQKDLISDLIKRYNLFIQTDPDNPKRLILDTRPDFYDRGTIVDWTDKKDYSAPDDIELLSDLQFKELIWSYKNDSDEVNKDYAEITGDTYGQYKYFFDNDFVKGSNKIESAFSPTPIVKTAFEALVPAINPQLPKVQPRVLYYGGLRDSESWFWNYQTPTGLTGVSESFIKYPYAGHFDDPINPEIDINFGVNKYYFYNDWSYITDNNMYNTYWSDYIRQIETGRLITSFFYLDEYDIRFIKDNFYTKIFILDSYYYVNKIIDYKPLINGTTKVELIKIVDGVRWEPKRTTSRVLPKPALPLNPLNQLVVGGGNSVSSGGGLVVGSFNSAGGKVVKLTPSGMTFTGPMKSAIIGDNNSNFGDKSMIIGDFNTIEGNRNMIIGGEGNYIGGSNITLIGSNNVSTFDSNKVYIGDKMIVDTLTGALTIGTTSILPLKYYTEGSGTSSGGTASIIISNSDYTTYNELDSRVGYGTVKTGIVNSINLNQSDLNITDDTLTLRLYDYATLTNAAIFSLENNSSNGYANLNIVSTASQTILNLDPSGTNGNTFFREQSTINSAYGYVAISELAIYSEVLDASSANLTTINQVGDRIEITPDAGTTNFIFRGTPAGYSTGQLLASGDALFKYDLNEWLSVGFDQYTLITKGYIDYLGLTSGGTVSGLHKVLGVGNTSSIDIELAEGSVSSPSYTFQSFSQSGLYHSFQHPTTSRVGIAVSGATSALFKSDSTAFNDGQRLLGGIHFINDVDTGIYRNTTNELSIAAGGLTAATFYTGSNKAGIKVPLYSTEVISNTAVSGTFTQSLVDGNTYTYTLTGNTNFRYSNATFSTYNFLVKAGTYSFTLDAASNYQTISGTALGFTGSFVMSAIYDGTDLWISTVRNYTSY